MKKLLIAALIACSMPAPAAAENWPPCCELDGRQVTLSSDEPLATEFSTTEFSLVETANKDGYRFVVVAIQRFKRKPLTKEQFTRFKPIVDRCSVEVSFSRGTIPYDVCLYDGIGDDPSLQNIGFVVARDPQPIS